MGSLAVLRIEHSLPADFAALATAAQAEGVRNMNLLQADWTSGVQRFDQKGAGLFGAFDASRLVGVGAVTREAGFSEPAMRMRRFYVLPAARQSGVGRRLAQVAMTQGFAHADVLTCNARATPLAAPFWKAMGFFRVDWPGITHLCRKA